jgi:two-component system phosphate regulon sensor histidine kinase PhoR
LEIDPATNQKFLGRIEEQADRLHHLILDMLTLARIESDHQAFEITSVDVPSAVRACLESQRPAADAKRIALTIESNGLPADAPCRVRADREGFREILDNLVDNAIKYTPEEGRVTVAWKGGGARIEEQGSSGEPSIQQPSTLNPQPSTLILSISDTGIGIKPADRERVFERFYRVDKARSRELGGTGLGLSIVKHLAQSFGGRVAVESVPGQGSTFTVELPAG